MAYNQQRRLDLDKLDANIREMENLGLLNQGLRDWEDDVTDPMEKTMVTKDKPFNPPRGRDFDPQRGRGFDPPRGRGFDPPRGRGFDPSRGRGFKKGAFRGRFQKRGRGRGGRQNWNRSMDDRSISRSETSSASSSYYSTNSGYGGFCSPRSDSCYESDSDTSHFTSVSQRQTSFSEKLTASGMAKYLAEFDAFQATLLQLLDKFQINHKLAERVARENSHTFQIEAELIRLRPSVKICSAYLNDGCTNREKCNDFHLCYKYVFGQCTQKDCSFGHFWLTDHNKTSSHHYNLNFLTVKHLSGLFKNYVLPKAKNDELRICDKYNEEKCENKECSQLHLCLKYIAKQCSENNCKLSHNVLDDTPSSVLQLHGLSLNESPRDILLTIANIPTIKKCIDSLAASTNSTSNGEASPESGKNDAQKSKLTPEVQDNREDESSKEVVPLKTIWSNELIGNTTLDEICFDSVEGFCPFEERGCWRLHCPMHFHWQAKATLGKKKCWVNLTEEQVLALEKGFCDPSVSKVNLPVLDPLKFKSEKGLLLILKGKSKWQANFDTMELILSDKNEVLELRRLCTEDTQNDIPAPCVWKWYFSDKNKKWIEYGNIDSTGEEQLKCNIDSKGIEKHFQIRSKSPLSFQNQSFSYLLDLQNMVQSNLSTNVTRKVRRRPAPHLKDKNKKDQSRSDFPIEWEPMQGEEKCKRVTLAPSSEEYKKINNHVNSCAQNNVYNILKIERVQNPYIYKAFQNKVQEMKATYKSDATVNIQQLFHGTGPDIVPRICDENFDWRLHGTSTGQAYGRGTYFSSLSSYSYGYARADPNGHRFMFIARVAVGTTTTGNTGMTRPPINPQYNLPFDSTVENMSNPTIIVKYDKQEYYPEYIITFG